MVARTPTEKRILAAARAVFAERGRRSATVRDICARARVNVAAISYHFGSKDALYRATLADALDEHFAAHPVPAPSSGDAETRLRTIVGGIATTILAPRPKWHDRLLLSELADPSPALDRMVREYVRPRFDALQRAIGPFLPGVKGPRLALHALSIIGQLFYYKHAHAVALRLLGQRTLRPALVRTIVEHVVDFSLRAMRCPR